MKMVRGFQWEADDKRVGMTLADLRQFVLAADEVNLDPRLPVKVQVGFRGQVQKIEPVSPPKQGRREA